MIKNIDGRDIYFSGTTPQANTTHAPLSVFVSISFWTCDRGRWTGWTLVWTAPQHLSFSGSLHNFRFPRFSDLFLVDFELKLKHTNINTATRKILLYMQICLIKRVFLLMFVDRLAHLFWASFRQCTFNVIHTCFFGQLNISIFGRIKIWGNTF